MKKRFHAPDISCQHCVNRIRAALEATGRAGEIHIDLETKTIRLDTDMASSQILAVLDDAGYPAEEMPA